MEIFKDFTKKHPKAAKWIREGGLFFLFSNLVTVWQYILIQFLPSVFSAYQDVEWMWPGVKMELFGAEFTFNILGYSAADGGMAYFIAYLIATFTAQCQKLRKGIFGIFLNLPGFLGKKIPVIIYQVLRKAIGFN